ncbi:MAG: choice-of-anchor L domain-containing protein, partial [Cryomorphaceae bacterium]|nr:choice-of-anchor L domain-containing protein [Cryomorphaceae bacterium]
MKKLLFLLGALLVFNAQSQIVIDNNPPYNTATYLIDNVLLGGGIIVSNHSFIGDPNQIGFFNGVNSNLGIDSGIVLSSGNVLDLVGPNASGSTSTDFLLPGDPTLDLVIAPDLTNDAAVLEFDFIPTSDTISFKYVFGSEEYLEFVNSYNDAFGFFLSGPNPAGGTYVNQNLAIVPGTANTPVTINNINDVINSAYYVDNGDGFTAPQNSDVTVIQFDGFTTPLTAIAAVNCGDTYHIKLVVADAVDGSWDSGIFLEAGSFFSPTLSVVDNLGIDSVIMLIDCSEEIILTADAGLGATYEWFDSTSVVFSTDSFVEVNAGVYIVAATIAGCTIFSDTLEVLSGSSDSLPPTSLNCVVESDGAFYFDWEHPFGASAVTNYQIMASSNIGGPYFNISEVNYPLTTYSHDASLLPFGTQFFYITTASVCVEALTSDTISPIYFSISHSNVNCWDDTDGSIQVSVENYINVLSYDFYLDGVLNLNAHPLDTFFNNVSAGSHIITVTDNSSGCLLDVPVTISAPGYPLQALASSLVTVCHGGSSGELVGSSAGGTPG